MEVVFKSRKLRESIKRVAIKAKSLDLDLDSLSVYGVTKESGVTVTGKEVGKNLGEYYFFSGKKIAYNPYRANIGSIGITQSDFRGLMSPAYVIFEVDDTIYPEFLLLYLKSSIGQGLIKWYGDRGGIRSSLRISDLGKIDFPDISYEDQKDFYNDYYTKKLKIDELLRELDYQEKLLDRLKKTALQDAIQGKLTKEWRKKNTSIESASELLKKIKTEKEKLIKEKKIKTEKPLPPITREEITFEIPDNWECTRLGEIAEFISSGSRDWSKYYSSEGAKFIRMGNLSKNSLEMRLDNIQFVDPPSKGEGTRTRLKKNDYLISITGDVGMLGKVPENFGEAYINQHTALVRILSILQNDFIDAILLSPYSAEQFNAPQRGIKNSFRLSDLKELIITLPPLAEQIAITEKVNQLVGSCDTLEQEINKSKTNAEKLMHSVLNKLLDEENKILFSKTATKKETEKLSREIHYNSKTLLMDLVKLLKENGKLHAEDLWKMSKYPNDIDAFYSELKKQIEEVKSIKEVANEKGYLELV